MTQYIRSPADRPVPTRPRAIVTMAIGTAYQRRWQKCCSRTWAQYADRHGYDLIVIEGALDLGPRAAARSPAWQKCLILDQPWSDAYRQIVWIDSDIIINPAAPDLAEGYPAGSGMVGAAICGDQLSAADKVPYMGRILRRPLGPREGLSEYARLQHQFYDDDGLPPVFDDMVSTGVMILDPARHRGLLAETYGHDGKALTLEQPKLSHQILSGGLLHRLSPLFNYCFFDFLRAHHAYLIQYPSLVDDNDPRIGAALQVAYDNAYFLHFSSINSFMDRIGAI